MHSVDRVSGKIKWQRAITRTDPDTLVQDVLHRCSRCPHVGELDDGDISLE